MLIGALSMAVLWLVILTIDSHAGTQMTRFVRGTVESNGGAAAQLSNNVSHVTRSVWELSYVYGPLMTFGAVAIILVVVMTRSAR